MTADTAANSHLVLKPTFPLDESEIGRRALSKKVNHPFTWLTIGACLAGGIAIQNGIWPVALLVAAGIFGVAWFWKQRAGIVETEVIEEMVAESNLDQDAKLNRIIGSYGSRGMPHFAAALGKFLLLNQPGNIYEGMHFHGNEIHHTGGHGEAFYLGANNDADGKTVTVFRNSLIEENYIHHLNGPEVSQGDGIEVKDGSYGNTIRNNVIHDTKYPGITVYGTDGNERNVIEHNVIWNTGDHGIQAASEALIRDNVVLDAGGDGIRSKPHQTARVGQLEILGNKIYNENGVGIRVDSLGEASSEVLIAGNVIAAGQAFRVPDDERVLRRENEVGKAPSDEEKQHLRERALQQWKSPADKTTQAFETETE